jgi:tetratricopeptide (TPR) repeat protein
MGMRVSNNLWAAALLAIAAPISAQDNNARTEGGHSEKAVSAAPASDEAEDTNAEAAHEAHEATPKPTAIVDNQGNGGFAIATDVPEAQAFFDNGMELAFAFAHQQAIDAMAEAVRRDPTCVMCLAGHAYTIGPTLNYGKDEDEREEAYEVARKALKLAKKGESDLERGYSMALVERYRSKGTTDDRDDAYAEAMAELAAKHPHHDSLQVLAADAQMISDFEEESMAKAMALVEPVLKRNPEHTGAIHFYIHATEIYGEPGKAEAAADRLAAMNLQASHLVHMPSHTYYWVGRYADAADANRIAVQIGEHQAMAMDSEDPMAVWGIPYHAHNVIFGLGGAMMADDSRTALMLARPMVERAQAREEGSYFGQLLMSSAYFAMARFEAPQIVLELEEPRLPYLKAAWRYARGEALAFLGDIEGAEREVAKIPLEVEVEVEEDRLAAADQMLDITRAVLTGRIAMMEGRYGAAAESFEEAATIEETEDFSRFSDPPAFWYPVRRDLAQALLAAGDEEGALREARKTLEVRPRDPVAEEIISKAG